MTTANSYPVPKMLGSPEPLPKKCGSRLHHDIAKFGMKRYCRQPAGADTPHKGRGCCKKHLGTSRQHIAKWVKIELEEELEKKKKEIQTFVEKMKGAPPIGDPSVELIKLMSQGLLFHEFLMEKVQDMNDQWATLDKADVERPKALLDKFMESMVWCRDTLVSMERLGIAKKKLQLEEDQARLIGAIVMAVLSGIDIQPDQLEIAKRLLAQQMQKHELELRPAEFIALEELDIVDAEIISE